MNRETFKGTNFLSAICSAVDVGCSHLTILIYVANIHTMSRNDKDSFGVPEETVCLNTIVDATSIMHIPLVFVVFEVPSGR